MRKTLALSAVLLVLIAPRVARADNIQTRFVVHGRIVTEDSRKPDAQKFVWAIPRTVAQPRQVCDFKLGDELEGCDLSVFIRHAKEGKLFVAVDAKFSQTPLPFTEGNGEGPPPPRFKSEKKRDTFTLCPGKAARLEVYKDNNMRLVAEVCVEVIPGLAQRNKDLVPALIRALRHNDEEIDGPVSEVLVRLGEDTVPALLKAAEGKGAPTRMKAITLLGKIAAKHGGAEELLPVLLKALEDDDQGVRRAAANAVRDAIAGAANAPAGSFLNGMPRARSGPVKSR